MQTGSSQLSIWLYEHLQGNDVLTVLTPEGYTPTKQEVIAATRILWEGEDGGEYLTHQCNLPLDAAVLTDPKRYGLQVIAPSRSPSPKMFNVAMTGSP